MYKLMLVDDEPLIREGLSRVVNWENYGVELAYSVDSAEEALEVLRAHEIDLMITDIRMPGMSGVELIGAARACQPELRSLVLSGYDDYALVRSAMRAGAMDYLLKPVSPEELENTIASAIQDMENSERGGLSIVDRSLFEHTMRRLLYGEIPPTEKAERLQYFGLDPNPGAALLSLVRPSVPIEWLRPALEEKLASIEGETCLFDDREGNLCVLCLSSGGIDARAVYEMICGVCQEAKARGDAAITGAIGQAGRGWRLLPERYAEALRCLDYALLRCEGEVKLCAGVAPFTPSAFDTARLRLLLQNGSVGAYGAFLDDWFAASGIDEADMRADLAALMLIRSALAIRVSACPAEEYDAIDRQRGAERALSETNDLQQIKRALLQILGEIGAEIAGGSEKAYTKLVARLLSVIRHEYADNTLCLKIAADRLGVNPSYLGRQFKAETGEFFNDCLTRVRVRQAEILLSTTDRKIADIALDVGFSSVNYFGLVFKKVTRVTPGDVKRAAAR